MGEISLKIVPGSKQAPKTPEEKLAAQKQAFTRLYTSYFVSVPSPLAREGYSNPNKEFRQCYGELGPDIPKSSLIPYMVSDPQYASSSKNKETGIKIDSNTFLSKEDYTKLSFDESPIRNGIKNLATELEAQYEKTQGSKRKITTVQPILNIFEKDDKRLYVIHLGFFTNGDFYYKSRSDFSDFQNPNTWNLIVSASKEADKDAFALGNYYKNLGVNCAVCPFEQNPQKKEGLHVREKIAKLSVENAELRAKIAELEAKQSAQKEEHANTIAAKDTRITKLEMEIIEANLIIAAFREEAIRTGNTIIELNKEKVALDAHIKMQTADILSHETTAKVLASEKADLINAIKGAISLLSDVGVLNARKKASETVSSLQAALDQQKQ